MKHATKDKTLAEVLSLMMGATKTTDEAKRRSAQVQIEALGKSQYPGPEPEN